MAKRQAPLLIALTALVLGAPEALEGQIQRMRSVEETTVGLQLSKAFIGDSGLSWYTSVLRGRILSPTGERSALLADWGVSLAGTELGRDATFLNPELGLAFVGEDHETNGYVSVILPLAEELGDDDVSAGVGFLSDFRWLDRYSEDIWSVNVAATPSAPMGDDGRTRANVEIMGSVLIPRNGGDTDLFARYAFGISHDTETLRLRADLNGLAIISEGDLSLGERTLHELVVGLDGLNGGPGFFVKVPIDDEFEQVDAVLGVTLTF
jgi:hypothetical protein